MKYNIIKDGENPRKQKLENSNSEEVKGFQRNSEIWNDGHHTGTQYGIELTVFELMKGLSKKYPQFDGGPTPANILTSSLLGSHWDIPEVIESIISVFEEMLGHDNPDAGMEERERELAEMSEGELAEAKTEAAMKWCEENALVERVTSTLTTLEGLEGKDD